MSTATFYNYQKILQGICCAGVQRLLWWLQSFSLWTRESQSTHGLANPRMTHVTSYLVASAQSLHPYHQQPHTQPQMGRVLLTSHPPNSPLLPAPPIESTRHFSLGQAGTRPFAGVSGFCCRAAVRIQQFQAVFSRCLKPPQVSRASDLRGESTKEFLHHTFLGGACPIAVGTTSALIIVEIIDSAVYPHYDRQKLKCIKHSNPSSRRWVAGANRVQRERLLLLTMAEVLTVRYSSLLLTRLFSQLPKSDK